MRHRHATKTLSRDHAARSALLRGLMTSLVLHGKIRTTKAKANYLRPQIERLITHAKKEKLSARRECQRLLQTPAAVEKMVGKIAPSMKDRKGGYTRILKIGRRAGDAAEMVQIELLT